MTLEIAYKMINLRGKYEKTFSVVRKGWQRGLPLELLADLVDISIEDAQYIIDEFEKEK